MCVLLQFFVLRKNPYYIYYLDWVAAEKQRVVFDEADEMDDYGMKVNPTGSQDADSIRSPGSARSKKSLLSSNLTMKSYYAVAQPPKQESLKRFIAMAKENFSKTHGLLYALLCVFVVTFIVFPAVSFDTNMKLLGNLANSQSWFVLLINTVFSIFDTVGRKMGGVKAFDLSSGGVKILTVSRVIFIATFYLIAF